MRGLVTHSDRLLVQLAATGESGSEALASMPGSNEVRSLMLIWGVCVAGSIPRRNARYETAIWSSSMVARRNAHYAARIGPYSVRFAADRVPDGLPPAQNAPFAASATDRAARCKDQNVATTIRSLFGNGHPWRLWESARRTTR